jgi:hypothetical protein
MNADLATRQLLRPPSEPVGADALAGLQSSGVRARAHAPSVASWLAFVERVSDVQLALALSAALFAVGAWPLLLTEVPPYQDLPNHLATATVIENIASYPGYVFNGFFKTNSALFTWLHFVGSAFGLKFAARTFAWLIMALNAMVIPRFVLGMTGSRGRMLVATFFAWPMIHNWFVCMGMLDFALAVPLSLELLLMLKRHRTAPRWQSGLAIVGLGAVTWYAHVFPLLVVHLLVMIESAVQKNWKERVRSALVMGIPLVPSSMLALMAILQHAKDTVGPMTGFKNFTTLLAPWELAYNLWAEWFWTYSNLSLTTLVPCVGLAIAAFWGIRSKRTSDPAFFSVPALLAIVLLYCFTPYRMTNWFHVNSRLIPYFWFAGLLFLPERLPRSVLAALGLCGVAYTAAMGVDFVRLDQERREFTAGIDAVPKQAKLLPLIFRHKSASANTRNLLHMWGYYVVDRQTEAPLLFAHSRSFPVTYSAPPPVRFNHLVLESFAPEMSTPASACATMTRVEDCDGAFRGAWSRFFAEALPRYDHLLLWEPTPEALAMIPSDYVRTFAQGRLMIYARRERDQFRASAD